MSADRIAYAASSTASTGERVVVEKRTSVDQVERCRERLAQAQRVHRLLGPEYQHAAARDARTRGSAQ